MAKSTPSMIALLGLLAAAGYQNRDKIAGALGAGRGGSDPAEQQPSGGLDGLLAGLGGMLSGQQPAGATSSGGGLEGMLGGLGGLLGGQGGGSGSGGGLEGLLGGLLGGQTAGNTERTGTGLDSALSGLSGALGGGDPASNVRGGLEDLVDSFRQGGHGDVADSWVTTGENRTLQPRQVEDAIGADNLAELSRRTGLSRDDVLERLANTIPMAVDKLTPEGRLPTATDAAKKIEKNR